VCVVGLVVSIPVRNPPGIDRLDLLGLEDAHRLLVYLSIDLLSIFPSGVGYLVCWAICTAVLAIINYYTCSLTAQTVCSWIGKC